MTLTTAEQRELLEKFIADNQELEELEAQFTEVNIFEAIGVVRREIMHSNFLAFLLNPSQNHRLGDIFLKRFLKGVLLESDENIDEEYKKISSFDIEMADLTDAEVRREWQNMDIFIHSPSNKLVCVIENKIDSSDFSGQLLGYQYDVEEHYEEDYKKILVYLNPKGIEATDEVANESWRVYNYSKIAEILDTIYTNYKSKLSTNVLTLINHYSILIRKHIVSNFEIVLCQKIYAKHKNALDLIFENCPDLQSDSQLGIGEFCQEIYNKYKHALDLIFEKRSDLQSSQIAKKLLELLEKGINSKELYISNFGKEIAFFSKELEVYKWELGMLSFQFEILPNSLVMTLILENTCNPSIKKIYDLLHQEDHKRILKRKKLNKKLHKMYEKKILEYNKDSNLEELMDKVYAFWNDFINDFLYVENIINDNLNQLIE
ncbi:MAG TPA: PD-(D/E)XK nuclease family protein [Nostocaceae cyanobacterium]|nr:PD-(D/E)XK nuclease family protein [Nostocaceae cyanobacterium]